MYPKQDESQRHRDFPDRHSPSRDCFTYRISFTNRCGDSFEKNEKLKRALFCFHKNIEEVKSLKKTHPVKKGRTTVEAMDFEEDEAEKLELVKRHMGLKQNKDVIKALILEKFNEIKLEEKNLAKQRIAEEKAKEYSENFTCPLFK